MEAEACVEENGPVLLPMEGSEDERVIIVVVLLFVVLSLPLVS